MKNHRFERTEYTKLRMKTDPIFKLSFTIRSNIHNGLNKFVKENKCKRTYEILGCTFEDLKYYLEDKFEPWMTWDNHGLYNGELNYGWDIDHIIPISSSKNIDGIYKLNHFSNLQPLCSKVNRDIKRNKLNYE